MYTVLYRSKWSITFGIFEHFLNAQLLNRLTCHHFGVSIIIIILSITLAFHTLSPFSVTSEPRPSRVPPLPVLRLALGARLLRGLLLHNPGASPAHPSDDRLAWVCAEGHLA